MVNSSFINSKMSLLANILTVCLSCSVVSSLTCFAQTAVYPDKIGDISFDAALDAADAFSSEGEEQILQYYAFRKKSYPGEKAGLEQLFTTEYDPMEAAKKTGLLRVRFIVSRDGRAGRFRTLGMDMHYREKEFDESLSGQIVQIIKRIPKWEIMTHNNTPYCYYQYLTFKIKRGKILEILP